MIYKCLNFNDVHLFRSCPWTRRPRNSRPRARSTTPTPPPRSCGSRTARRVWRAGEPETKLECLLNNNKNSDFCAPLTSFDWNEVDPNLLGTSSIDTTCTVWGLETDQVIIAFGSFYIDLILVMRLVFFFI